jgi:hypothetical protein
MVLELPEGMALPAIDPGAKGGWQGPDDLVVSTTPLWPRPNRSWRWILAWLLTVVRTLPLRALSFLPASRAGAAGWRGALTVCMGRWCATLPCSFRRPCAMAR